MTANPVVRALANHTATAMAAVQGGATARMGLYASNRVEVVKSAVS